MLFGGIPALNKYSTVEIHNILDKISEQSSLFEEILLGFLET